MLAGQITGKGRGYCILLGPIYSLIIQLERQEGGSTAGAKRDICQEGRGCKKCSPPKTNVMRNLSLHFLIMPSKVIRFNTKNKGYQKQAPPLNHQGRRHIPAPPTRYAPGLRKGREWSQEKRRPEGKVEDKGSNWIRRGEGYIIHYVQCTRDT